MRGGRQRREWVRCGVVWVCTENRRSRWSVRCRRASEKRSASSVTWARGEGG